jgi:hypothetical protein
MIDTALIQQITISRQPSPSPRDLRFLREWIEDPYGLANSLRGPDSRLWFAKDNGEYKLDDKVALWPEFQGVDSFTQNILKAGGKLAFILPFLNLEVTSDDSMIALHDSIG